MAMKGFSTIPNLQHYVNLSIRLFCVISMTFVGGGGFTLLQRYSRCILQPQPTRQALFVSNMRVNNFFFKLYILKVIKEQGCITTTWMMFCSCPVVSILLYGCITWTLTKRMEKKLDGNYTRMLRAILNKSRRQHPTMQQLYGHLPSTMKSI